MNMEEKAKKALGKNLQTPNSGKKKPGEFHPSVVEIRFLSSGLTLPYYSDNFDLREGDMVYVDGKMEGRQGEVVRVSHNFKIDLDNYHRVVEKLNTEVHGTFYSAKHHFFTLDQDAIPVEQVRPWLIAPKKSVGGLVIGWDDSGFPLDDLEQMDVSPQIADRGVEYYLHHQVLYLNVSGTKGYAIVRGNQADPYEVEFCYQDGEISRLTCNCYCTGHCKHMVAVMLQLREMLAVMQQQNESIDPLNSDFSAILKEILTFYADLKRRPSFRL